MHDNSSYGVIFTLGNAIKLAVHFRFLHKPGCRVALSPLIRMTKKTQRDINLIKPIKKTLF